MTSNEELITDLRRMSGDYGKKMRGELEPDVTYSWDGGEITAWEAADALEAASHEPLPLTVAQLEALPELTVLLDHDDDVWQKRGGVWASYETEPAQSQRVIRYGPHVILYTPPAVGEEPKR
jgi:hypothetical protein